MSDMLPFKVGDIIKIYQKVTEGKRERLVPFKGTVVDIKGSAENTMFTVRQSLERIGVDRIFPYHTPTIQKIELIEKPKKRVRKANLLRKKT